MHKLGVQLIISTKKCRIPSICVEDCFNKLIYSYKVKNNKKFTSLSWKYSQDECLKNCGQKIQTGVKKKSFFISPELIYIEYIYILKKTKNVDDNVISSVLRLKT